MKFTDEKGVTTERQELSATYDDSRTFAYFVDLAISAVRDAQNCAESNGIIVNDDLEIIKQKLETLLED